jgi:hypothetical protein
MADLLLNGPPPGSLDHFSRNIYSHQAPGRSRHLGRPKSDQPGSAGDVQDPVAGTNRRKREQTRLGRLELVFPRPLVIIDRAIPSISLNAALQFGVHAPGER